jgi:hypothetical protein
MIEPQNVDLEVIDDTTIPSSPLLNVAAATVQTENGSRDYRGSGPVSIGHRRGRPENAKRI